MAHSTGYGPSNTSRGLGRYARLIFDGDERKYEQWEVKFLGYMRLQKLKDTILPPPDTEIDAAKNEEAFAELIQFLDDKSLSLVMRDAIDDGKKALEILRQHYAGSAAFIGCMKNANIQSVDVDPVKVVHSQLGVGLSLGDCDLVDWCQREGNETVCQNGGRCRSLWRGPACDCSTTNSFEGPFCQTFVDSRTVTFTDSSSYLLFRLDTAVHLLSTVISLSFRTSPPRTDRAGRTTSSAVLALYKDVNTSVNVALNGAADVLSVKAVRDGETIADYNISLTLSDVTCPTWTNLSLALAARELVVNGHVYRLPDVATSADLRADRDVKQTISVGSTSDDASNRTEWLINVGGSREQRGFLGCMTGLYIGDYQFQLAKAAVGLSGIKSGCSGDWVKSCASQRPSSTERPHLQQTTFSPSVIGQDGGLSLSDGVHYDVPEDTKEDGLDDVVTGGDVAHKSKSSLLQTAEIHVNDARRHYADPAGPSGHDIDNTSIIGLCVVTTLLVACVVLAALSLTWRHVRHQRMTVLHREFAREMGGDDEEEGLLTDVPPNAPSTPAECKSTAPRLHQTAFATKTDQVSGVKLDLDVSTKRDHIELSRMSIPVNAGTKVFGYCNGVGNNTTGKDVGDRSAAVVWDTEELDTAAQMEWDPQSDVGSPMLPVHEPDSWYVSQ